MAILASGSENRGRILLSTGQYSIFRPVNGSVDEVSRVFGHMLSPLPKQSTRDSSFSQLVRGVLPIGRHFKNLRTGTFIVSHLNFEVTETYEPGSDGGCYIS